RRDSSECPQESFNGPQAPPRSVAATTLPFLGAALAARSRRSQLADQPASVSHREGRRSLGLAGVTSCQAQLGRSSPRRLLMSQHRFAFKPRWTWFVVAGPALLIFAAPAARAQGR